MAGKLHRNPPFRAEHLGSLLRPHDLVDTRAKLEKKAATEADLEKVEDVAINNIVKDQVDLGFHAISDGEYRRHSMRTHSCPLPFRSLTDSLQCSGAGSSLVSMDSRRLQNPPSTSSARTCPTWVLS